MKQFVLALPLVPTRWVSIQAQNLTSADDVLNAYVKAISGKKALLNLKDLSWKAASGANGVSFPTIIHYKAPLKVAITSTTHLMARLCTTTSVMGGITLPFMLYPGTGILKVKAISLTRASETMNS